MHPKILVNLLGVTAIVVGSTLIGCEYGWMVGAGIGCVAWGIMPQV
jgi:hypothetical protein